MRNIKIGSDPELIAVVGGDIAPANDFLDDNEDIGRFGGIGCDGSETVAEIRPTPYVETGSIVKSIAALLGEIISRYKGAKWIASPCYEDYGLGGHLHFGINAIDDSKKIEGSRLAKLLDKYLAIPLRVVYNPSLWLQRIENGYGNLSDFRAQEHGVEYRSIPTFLNSPELTRNVFNIAKYIYSNNKKLTQTIPESVRDVYQEYNKCVVKRERDFKSAAISYLREISRCDGAREILKLIENNKIIKAKEDIRDNWNKIKEFNNNVAHTNPVKDIYEKYKIVFSDDLYLNDIKNDNEFKDTLIGELENVIIENKIIIYGIRGSSPKGLYINQSAIEILLEEGENDAISLRSIDPELSNNKKAFSIPMSFGDPDVYCREPQEPIEDGVYIGIHKDIRSSMDREDLGTLIGFIISVINGEE